MVFQEPLRYTRITPHFFWNEMLASVEADKNNIINAPITEAQTENIITTANHMEKIRELTIIGLFPSSSRIFSI